MITQKNEKSLNENLIKNREKISNQDLLINKYNEKVIE